MKKLKLVIAISVVVMLLLSGCSGKKTGPSNMATVNITLSAEDNGSVEGALALLVSNNENVMGMYMEYTTESFIKITDVEFGTYTLTIASEGYEPYVDENFVVAQQKIDLTVKLEKEEE